MKELSHCNILKIYGVCLSKPFSIIMEFMPNGSLLDVLRSKPDEYFTEADKRNIARQVYSEFYLMY